ncbi:hypothetical protein A8C75_04325 [Marinobacterium aestuarii]|uniref:Transglycosylase SLT domain-containing protein n=1 Tax=Marinobacterium aestuarii TaxID=1821621 RepID=A0A1A9EW56_9GAMM|nr:hypothetical protein [Marinobacterium aestuarii]ANG61779.1 hypothetical protein A8C75_04325 [Marinobacterium aestuarii]
MNSSSTTVLPIKRLILLAPVVWLAGCASVTPSWAPGWAGGSEAATVETATVEMATPATCTLLERQGPLRVALQDTRSKWGLEPAVALALLEPPLGGGRKRHVLPFGNTWDEYRIAESNWSATTDDIADAVDFLGWGVARNRQMLQLDIQQVDALYLAYRLGPGAYSQGVHKGIWIEKEAERVAARARQYSDELQRCPELVDSSRWEWRRLWSWW